MNRLADLLSLLRIALVPVFLAVAWATHHPPEWAASRSFWRGGTLVVLAISGISDWLDGYVARRSDRESRWGAILDAVGDRAAQLTVVAFFTLVESPAFPSVPLWFLGVVLARDFFIGAGALTLRLAGREQVEEHRWHGRLATFLMFFFLLWIAAGLPLPGGDAVFLGFSVLLLGSALLYLIEDARRLRGRR